MYDCCKTRGVGSTAEVSSLVCLVGREGCLWGAPSCGFQLDAADVQNRRLAAAVAELGHVKLQLLDDGCTAGSIPDYWSMERR